MRSFAKPAPHTMTKEWQEATNEYLKVRTFPCSAVPVAPQWMANMSTSTGPKLGPVDRYLVRRLQRQGPRAIPFQEGITEPRFTLSIDATLYTGIVACVTRISREIIRWAEHWGLLGLILGGVNTVQR